MGQLKYTRLPWRKTRDGKHIKALHPCGEFELFIALPAWNEKGEECDDCRYGNMALAENSGPMYELIKQFINQLDKLNQENSELVAPTTGVLLEKAKKIKSKIEAPPEE